MGRNLADHASYGAECKENLSEDDDIPFEMGPEISIDKTKYDPEKNRLERETILKKNENTKESDSEEPTKLRNRRKRKSNIGRRTSAAKKMQIQRQKC